MFSRKAEIIRRLEARVEDLEFRICEGNHDWVEIDRRDSFDRVDAILVTQKCRRCGKVRVVVK